MANTTINVCYAILEVEARKNILPTSLRGFIGYLFTNIPEFHHHSEKSYHYPMVQYKNIRGHPSIIGLNEFAQIVYEKISQLEYIMTSNEKLRVSNIQLKTLRHEITSGSFVYYFISPWIALNEENYIKWKLSIRNNRKEMLEKILLGNILSMLKGLGIFVNYRVIVQLLGFKTRQVTAHNNKFVGIDAHFTCNLDLPEYIGLGKSVSKGYGTLEHI
jgi:hypothetical protein